MRLAFLMPAMPAIRRTAAAAVGAAALATLAACGPADSPAVAEPVRPAYVTTVREAAAAEADFMAEVRATQRAELGFAVAGRVAAVLVEPGDVVQAGQLLARLDERPLQAQQAAAQADVARQQAQLAELHRRLARVQQARQAEADAVSATESGAAETELAAAEAALRAARAQLDAATWSLSQGSLRAPMAGVIATRLLEPGQAAGPGAPALVIDGAGRELSVRVPATLALRPGQSVMVQQAGRAPQASRVLRVAGRLEAGGLRRVTLAAPAEADVGATWSVALGGAGEPARLLVPLRAVLPAATAGRGEVLRLGADGRTTERVAVLLGPLQGDWVTVREGLRRGDRVVVAGALSIRPGSAVQPVDYKGGVSS